MNWSGKFPTCEPKCQLLKWPNNGFIACSNNNLVGSRCDYSCDDDFILRGKSETTCLSFNESISVWDDEMETSCDPLCNPILKFENGIVNCTGRAQSDICTFKCNDSFNIIGYRNGFTLTLKHYRFMRTLMLEALNRSMLFYPKFETLDFRAQPVKIIKKFSDLSTVWR